ncbi:MAG: MBL fold metallo-hydrolase, partial [Myxococcota bacterium]
PVGIEIIPAGLDFRDIDPIGSVRLGELELSWTELAHPSGSTAWRLAWRDTTVVFTGDVELQHGCQNRLIEFASGADILIMDAQYLPEEYPSRRGFGHSSCTDAVHAALEAEVGALVLTHHDPSHDDDRLDHKLGLAQSMAGGALPIVNAYDGLHL